MTEKPNCSASRGIKDCGGCKTDPCEIKPETKLWCPYHSQLREYLMKDVIKDLEEIDKLVPHPQYLHMDLSESLTYIPASNCVRIHKIIALIRDGVK